MTNEQKIAALELELNKLKLKIDEDSETLRRMICDYYTDKDDLITIRIVSFYKRKKAYYKKMLIEWLQK